MLFSLALQVGKTTQKMAEMAAEATTMDDLVSKAEELRLRAEAAHREAEKVSVVDFGIRGMP